jgi:hypothetical protein
MSTETAAAKYAHEVIPHPEEGETAPLETLVRYHYAQAEGWIKAFSDAIGASDYGPAGADFTLASFMGHMHRALLFDALAQGLTGQAAADWANTRNHSESAEWIWERAAAYGLDLEATPIRAYRYKRETAEVSR